MDQHHHEATTPHDVPAYRVDDLSERRNRHCVIVFVINEGDKVRKQLARMQAHTDVVDVIVADGGSTDGSLDLPFLREHSVRALLTKTGGGKLSAQMRMGFAWALEQGYEGVVVVDGNGKDDISAIPDFVRLLEQGYDHVQGSRFIPGGHAINTPRSRLLGLKLLHAPVLSIASGRRQTDTTNGFRAYSAALLRDPRIAVFRDVFSTYELHYHLTIESARLGYRTAETPVTRRYPKGKVPTKISPLRGNAMIIRILFTAAFGGYRQRNDRKELS